jgi:hypothetical protein
MIFSHVLAEHVQVYPGVSYTAFLVPGLIMMSMLQNAFANSSSSLIQSKITGNIVFVLLPPLSYLVVFRSISCCRNCARIGSRFGRVRGTLAFTSVSIDHPIWLVLFAILCSGILGALGVIAGDLGREV